MKNSARVSVNYRSLCALQLRNCQISSIKEYGAFFVPNFELLTLNFELIVRGGENE
nr:hypothetical protein [uncultured archaeon]